MSHCTTGSTAHLARLGRLFCVAAFLSPATAAADDAIPDIARGAGVNAQAATVRGSGAGDRNGYAGRPDWPGIKRDTWYFLGYQFAAVGVLYAAPEAVSGWSEAQKDNYSLSRWADNAGNPTWDEDRWWINYVLHPYWGGAYYIRARERGYGRGDGLRYSALLSTLFEFGAEALFEQPSYQDLVVTPVAGYLIGEYLFTPIRQRIRAQSGAAGAPGKALLVLTDPLGAANATLEHFLGAPATLHLRPHPAYAGTHTETRGWQLRLLLVW